MKISQNLTELWSFKEAWGVQKFASDFVASYKLQY